MVIYAESSAVEDPTVLKDEKFAAVRSQIFIFKEGELYFFIYNGSRMRKLKGMIYIFCNVLLVSQEYVY